MTADIYPSVSALLGGVVLLILFWAASQMNREIVKVRFSPYVLLVSAVSITMVLVLLGGAVWTEEKKADQLSKNDVWVLQLSLLLELLLPCIWFCFSATFTRTFSFGHSLPFLFPALFLFAVTANEVTEIFVPGAGGKGGMLVSGAVIVHNYFLGGFAAVIYGVSAVLLFVKRKEVSYYRWLPILFIALLAAGTLLTFSVVVEELRGYLFLFQVVYIFMGVSGSVVLLQPEIMRVNPEPEKSPFPLKLTVPLPQPSTSFSHLSSSEGRNRCVVVDEEHPSFFYTLFSAVLHQYENTRGLLITSSEGDEVRRQHFLPTIPFVRVGSKEGDILPSELAFLYEAIGGFLARVKKAQRRKGCLLHPVVALDALCDILSNRPREEVEQWLGMVVKNVLNANGMVVLSTALCTENERNWIKGWASRTYSVSSLKELLVERSESLLGREVALRMVEGFSEASSFRRLSREDVAVGIEKLKKMVRTFGEALPELDRIVWEKEMEVWEEGIRKIIEGDGVKVNG